MKILSVHKQKLKDDGFTLVEVLVSLAIVSVLIAAMALVFERSSRLYTTQNTTAALQQEVRAALDVIVSESRMAAYMPRKSSDKFEITTSSATHFRFQADLNEDGDSAKAYNVLGECENRSFRFSLANRAIQIICGEGTGSKDTETLIGGNDANVQVVSLDFSYRDKNNSVTSLASEIRGAIITITAEAPAGREGMIRRTFSTWVDFRNTGPNA